MSNLVTELLKRERRRQLLVSIAAAIIIAALVLSASYGLSSVVDDITTGDTGSDNTGNTGTSSYTLSLSETLDQSFNADEILLMQVSGNRTGTIHPQLLHSKLRPTGGDDWTAFTTIRNDAGGTEKVELAFTASEVGQLHTEFITSLNSTTEVEEPAEIGGNIPQQLFYEVYLTNNSVISFQWAGYEDADVMEVAHRTWSGDISDPVIHVAADQVHYISPKSAFDSFIDLMSQLYTEKLE